MPKKSETRRVPAHALRFDAALEFVADAPRDDPNRVPIRMLARSGEAIEHPYWGKVVHDLDGMTPRKPRIQLDWCHWEWEQVGYADTFDVSTGDLIVTGELVSTHEGDEASRIIAKGQAGIPYEASIDFNGPGVRMEELGEDTSAMVNGRNIEGPALIIREWPLRSVAICPYGADYHSQSEFSDPGGEIDVTIFQRKEQTMHKKLAAALNESIKKWTKKNGQTKRQATSRLAKAAGITVKEMTAILQGGGSPISQAAAAKRFAAWSKSLSTPVKTFQDAWKEDEKARQLAEKKKKQQGKDDDELEDDDDEMEDDDELEDDDEMEDDDELEDGKKKKKQQSNRCSSKSKNLSAERKELKRFIAEFGPNHGARWFSEGKTYHQALALHANRMKKLAQQKLKENKKLRRQLASLDTGEENPVGFNDGGDRGGNDNKKLAQMETKVGSNLARFAAGVTLPGRKK